MGKSKVVVIAGPTASGKSDLAVTLAQKFNGEIISADSRQVYKGMDIGTGKVTKKEQRGIRHWLIDVADPRRTYTVARYKKEAAKAVREILRHGKLPIICGGTGLYIDALIYDQSLPEVKPDAKLRAQLEKFSTSKLLAKLKKVDPDRAKNIDGNNRRRLVRALEIVIKSGKPVPLQFNGSPYEPLNIGMSVPKQELAKRIAKRLDQRLRHGMIAEVTRLRKNGVSWRRLESLGLEYRWVARFLQKQITRQQMRDGLLADIIKYSKRQMTWFKRNSDIVWITSSTQAIYQVRKFIS